VGAGGATLALIAFHDLAARIAAVLLGLGFVGAALLAASIVPLSTAYPVAEATGAPRT
jgi:hypothetical protein